MSKVLLYCNSCGKTANYEVEPDTDQEIECKGCGMVAPYDPSSLIRHLDGDE